jgi:hypothetical protein
VSADPPLTARCAELAEARELLRAQRRLTLLPEEVAWPDPGAGMLRARQALSELLTRFGLPADRARVDDDIEDGEPAWTNDRVVLPEGFEERPFVLWEIALYTTRLVTEGVADHVDLMILCVALGLGPLIGGATRTRSTTRTFAPVAPVDDDDLGALIAEQLWLDGAEHARIVATLRTLRPSVRRGFEDAHASLEHAPLVDGVPSPLRRTWLSEQLNAVVRAVAEERRWLTPTPEDFPDPFTADLPSVRRLAERLLTHAGLGGRRVVLDVIEEGSDALAWFEFIDDERVRFGVRSDITGDGPYVASSLAHEVAHAFRRHHGLEVSDLDEEEELTDLTTVVLGFGLLLGNTTWRRVFSGSRQWTAHSAVGYLEAADFAWLLASEARRTRMEPSTFRRMLGHLGPLPRDALVAATRTLDGKAPPSPLVFPLLLVGGALVGVSLIFLAAWTQAAGPREPCGTDGDCRTIVSHVCVANRCAPPCAHEDQCAEGERCITARFPARGRYCVR